MAGSHPPRLQPGLSVRVQGLGQREDKALPAAQLRLWQLPDSARKAAGKGERSICQAAGASKTGAGRGPPCGGGGLSQRTAMAPEMGLNLT